jgi:hypothetical protein
VLPTGVDVVRVDQEFVSTNVLSLVPLVTGRLDSSAEMESSIEEGQRPTLRVLVCLVLADKGLDLCR